MACHQHKRDRMSYAAQLDPEEFYRTNEMSLATYLEMRGHALQVIRWESNTCYWVFRVTDAILDDIEDFSSGNALVEPREYNRVFTRVKREFYDSKDTQESTK